MAKLDGGDTYAECAEPGSDKEGVRCGWIWCCNGEFSGEPLDNDERSEVPDVTDCRCNESVNAATVLQTES